MAFGINNPFGFFGGLQIVTSVVVGDPYEDWSAVRSIGRARRRRKKHPQRIVTRYKANGKCVHDKERNVVYVHPADYVTLHDALAAKP